MRSPLLKRERRLGFAFAGKSPQKIIRKQKCVSGDLRPRQGTEICNFGEISPLDSLNFPSGIFSFSQVYRACNLVRESPQNVENIAPFPAREKKRRIMSRLWLSWLFRSWVLLAIILRGRKMSGKNTCCNARIVGLEVRSLFWEAMIEGVVQARAVKQH